MTNKTFDFTSPQVAYRGMLGAFLRPRFQIDYVGGQRSVITDVEIRINNPHAGQVNYGVVGFGKDRWFKLLREYTDGRFIDFLKLGAAIKKPLQEVTYQTPLTNKHTLGNCLLAISIGKDTVTMYSRASMWIRTGIADLSLGVAVCNWLKEQTGREYHFNWHIRQLQMCAMRAVPVAEYYGFIHELRVADYDSMNPFAKKVYHYYVMAKQGELDKSPHKPTARVGRQLKTLLNHDIASGPSSLGASYYPDLRDYFIGI